jgi:hypothetical protein
MEIKKGYDKMGTYIGKGANYLSRRVFKEAFSYTTETEINHKFANLTNVRFFKE